MSLSVTARGTGSHNSSATTFTLSPGSNPAAGSMLVLAIAADNAEASGVAFTFFGVTDDQDNIWTRQVMPLYDPGAANAGVTGAQFTTDMAGGTLTTASVITVTFDTATTAKAWAMWEVVPAAGQYVSYVTGGVNTGASTGTPTVTTSSITSGDVVIGTGHAENTDSWTGDADATNGSWSAQQHTGVGAGAAAISVTSQSKVTTGTATQTYNPTRTASNCILSWIQLTEIPYLKVGAVDQSSNILYGSMTLRFNQLDLTLKNPGTTPALGDAVTLAYPYWTGTVSSVQTTDATKTYKYVHITATNTNVAAASAATFGLSDAPDNVTTFNYSDLSVTLTTNIDTTTTTTGVLTTKRAGLWPAMTFNLTNANRGYSAQSFSVTDVTVTWPLKTNPLFRIGFGDPIVTMSVWVASQAANAPDGSISGTKITDLSVTTPKLAANAVTAAKIAAGTITANEIATGTLTADRLNVSLSYTGIIIFSKAAVGNNILSTSVSGDADTRFLIGAGGLMGWGDGTGGRDIYLSRTASQTLTISNDSGGTAPIKKFAVLGALEVHGGTSFPASPATNDLFYRTDLGQWFYYDGTQWVSENVFLLPIQSQTVLDGGTANNTIRGPTPGVAIYLIDVIVAVNVSTTNNSTNFWTFTPQTVTGAGAGVGVGSAFDTQTDGVATWVTHTVSVNAVVASTVDVLQVVVTKTLTPGAVISPAVARYRQIGT